MLGSFLATRWVRLMPRPTPVSRISAPASCATRATLNAMLSSVSTPVMSSFLPSSNMRAGGSSEGTARPIVPVDSTSAILGS